MLISRPLIGDKEKGMQEGKTQQRYKNEAQDDGKKRRAENSVCFKRLINA